MCHLCSLLQTAHVGALFPAFVTMMLTAGVPPPIACLSLGYMTNLVGRPLWPTAWLGVAALYSHAGSQVDATRLCGTLVTAEFASFWSSCTFRLATCLWQRAFLPALVSLSPQEIMPVLHVWIENLATVG